MGNRFLTALYRPSGALLDQIFMQRWGLLTSYFICCNSIADMVPVREWAPN
jgi:hypothetical protein